jgi:hypothetical protein
MTRAPEALPAAVKAHLSKIKLGVGEVDDPVPSGDEGTRETFR